MYKRQGLGLVSTVLCHVSQPYPFSSVCLHSGKSQVFVNVDEGLAVIVADVTNKINDGASSYEEEDQHEFLKILIPTASQATNYGKT